MDITKLFSVLFLFTLISCGIEVSDIAEKKEGEKTEETPLDDLDKQTVAKVPPSVPPSSVNPSTPPSLPLSAPIKESTEPPQVSKNPAKQVEFSNELLRAVNNWKRIPKTVFPLKNVSIYKDVVFQLTGPQNEIVASSLLPKGKEVVARGIQGTNLMISPSLDSKLIASIEMDNTDFKLGVAYRFEIGKKIIQMREDRMKKALLSQQSNSEKASNRIENTANEQEITDELLIPGDFGHGKFCICSDCRQKRLAKFGSLK